MDLPWRWFGLADAEPDCLGELRSVLALVSEVLPELDAQQARWPRADWGDRPDPRAGLRHWLVDQPQLQPVREGLERLGFGVEGEPLPYHKPGDTSVYFTP